MEEKVYHNIQSYLGGTMSANVLMAFEEELKTNSELREEVELYKSIIYHLKDIDNEEEVFSDTTYKQTLTSFVTSEEGHELDVKLKAIGKAYHTTSKKKAKQKTKKSRVIYFALSTAAVFAVVFSMLNFGNTSGVDLYNSYYESSDLPSFVSRGEEKTLLSKATISFNTLQLDKALQQFTDYIDKKEDVNPLVFIYTGLIKAEQGDIQLAIQQFDLLENSNAIDKSKALWFKALTYLRFEQKPKAKAVLQTIISDSNNFKFKEAKELLEKI